MSINFDIVLRELPSRSNCRGSPAGRRDLPRCPPWVKSKPRKDVRFTSDSGVCSALAHVRLAVSNSVFSDALSLQFLFL